MNRQEIGAIYGVPEMMMGIDSQGKSLGNGLGKEQDRFNFIESTITPLCRRLEAAVEPIVKSFGPDLCGWFDVDALPVMQEARRARVDTATKVFAMGVPFNEVNDAYELGFKPLPWGNTGYVAGLLQPVGGTVATEPGDAEAGEPADAEKANPFSRLGKMLAVVKTAQAKTPPMGFEEAIAPSLKLKRDKLNAFFFTLFIKGGS